MKILVFIFTICIGQLTYGEISLIQNNNFGSNPGKLKMYTYVPDRLKEMPLVVLLHGCAQAASDFDDETGWVREANEKGFILLLPQQIENNNDWRCFNWFEKSNLKRGEGEAYSIIQMIEKAKQLYDIDEQRVFISGISAGGAMTDAMLALYPEYFKGGAVVAGIPFGCATNGFNAWSCMYGIDFPKDSLKRRLKKIREASEGYEGPWPSVIVIHGTKDQFVRYSNALVIIEQWMNIHEISKKSVKVIKHKNYVEKNYLSTLEERKVQLVSIPGMKHGYPVSVRQGCGSTGKFILDVEICAAKD